MNDRDCENCKHKVNGACNVWDCEFEPKFGTWIPVSERLPKNDEDVLVCYPRGGMEVVYYHIDNSIYPTGYKDLNETGWCNEEGDALYFEPIAWMPLPELYKAEGSKE